MPKISGIKVNVAHRATIKNTVFVRAEYTDGDAITVSMTAMDYMLNIPMFLANRS